MKRYSLGIVQTHATQFDGPLFKRLSRRPDIELTVYYTKPSGKAPFDKEIGQSPDWDTYVTAGYRYKTRDTGFFDAVRFMLKVVNGNHYLIIISGYLPFYHLLIAVYARLKGVAVGLRSDTTFLYTSQYSAKSILKRLIIPFILRLYSSAHQTGTLAKQYLLQYGFPENRLFRFPYAVDNDYLATRCSRYRLRQDRVRRAVGIEHDSFVVLGILKFVEREDPMTLLSGFTKLLESRPTAHLVLVGDGPMMKDIKDIIGEKAISNVHLPGFVRYSQLPLFYSIADVFVHPPARECWGVSVNEAMACGLPVVVANTVGSHVDLVQAGQTGFVFEVGNPAGLASCLKKLAGDSELRDAMGERCATLIADWSYDFVEQSLLNALAAVTMESKGR